MQLAFQRVTNPEKAKKAEAAKKAAEEKAKQDNKRAGKKAGAWGGLPWIVSHFPVQVHKPERFYAIRNALFAQQTSSNHDIGLFWMQKWDKTECGCSQASLCYPSIDVASPDIIAPRICSFCNEVPPWETHFNEMCYFLGVIKLLLAEISVIFGMEGKYFDPQLEPARIWCWVNFQWFYFRSQTTNIFSRIHTYASSDWLWNPQIQSH